MKLFWKHYCFDSVSAIDENIKILLSLFLIRHAHMFSVGTIFLIVRLIHFSSNHHFRFEATLSTFLKGKPLFLVEGFGRRPFHDFAAFHDEREPRAEELRLKGRPVENNGDGGLTLTLGAS